MISINKILLPIVILKKTLKFFKKYGDNFLEAYALWVGKEMNTNFEIENVCFPNQENTMISYYISDIDVHYINVKLNKKKYSAIAQLHTHPGEAFHSSIDGNFSILTLPGSFSIVIPEYGNIAIDALDRWEVFRLLNQKWTRQSKEKVRELFRVIK